MVGETEDYALVGEPRKKTRAKGPKARSGCLSCKIRHVKCDERKPGCLRCEKFGCECEGYSKAPTRSKQLPDRVLFPKISAQFQPIFYQPSNNMFQNNEEHQYFQLFWNAMAPHLAGIASCDFWTRIVLQACESDTAVRYAVIALAALKSTSESKTSSLAWTEVEQLKARVHHQFAIKSYSKAVKHMRNATLGGKQDLRSTLINCMVLVCFETFHGDHASAAKQIGIGLSLIEDHLVNHKVFTPASPYIESELLTAFGQLEIQALTFGESRSKEAHKRLTGIDQDRVESMPSQFSDFTEALFYFEIIQQRFFHFMASVLVATCKGCLTLDNSLSLDVKDLPKRAAYLGEYGRWHDALKPLLKQARESGDRDSLFFGSSLQLLYLTGYVAAIMVRDSDHEYSETWKFMPMFTQMLALSKSVLKYSPEAPGRSSFKIGMQVICPLYSVARRCPHRATRKEAISVLLSHHRREGLWDSMLSGKLGEWVMELEEDNYQGEYIPEHLRCAGMSLVSCDMVLRRAHVRGVVPTKDGTKMITREKIITW